MIRTKKFENLPQITSISPSGKIVVTENGVDKVISFEDFSNLPPTADVWDNSSTTFTASEVNVTDIQSAADSKLLDLKVNTVSKFKVDKVGKITGNALQIGDASLASPAYVNISNTGVISFSGSGTGIYEQAFILPGGGGYFRRDGASVINSLAGEQGNQYVLNQLGLRLGNLAYVGWSSGNAIAYSSDTFLFRDGVANILAMRNGVNAQTFRLYNTYTNATTFERLNIKWDTNVLKIGTEKGSVGGSARDLAFETDAITRMTVTSAGFVGIGTTTPNYFFSVKPSSLQAGQIGVSTYPSGVAPALFLQNFNGTESYFVGVNNSGQISIGNSGYNILQSAGYFTNIRGNNTLVEAGNGTCTVQTPQSRIYLEYSPSNILFYAGTTTTERMRILGSNGNIGIGTTEPAARLDIADTTLAGSGSLAGSVLNLTQTWNTSGAPTAIKLNVTNTASGAASNLLDLQVDTISKFKITKSGAIDFGPSNTASQRSVINSGSGQLVTFTRGDVPTAAYSAGGIYNGQVAGLFLGSGLGLQWSSGSWADGGGYDLFITRRGAANLRLGNQDFAAPVAQTLSVQSVIAGTTNTAGANFTIDGSQGTGTGAGGSIIFRTAKATTSSSTVNSLTEAMSINSNGLITLLQAQTTGGLDLNNYGLISSFDWQLRNVNGFIGLGANFSVADTRLYRDAANILALRNGINAQAFRLYNTYTDATTFERLNIKWDTNVLKIGTEKGSVGGSARDLAFETDGITRMDIHSTGGYITVYNNDGGLATHVQHNAGAWYLTGNGIQIANSANFRWNGDLGISRNSAGVAEINNTTSGQYRDLILRNITSRGNIVIGTITSSAKLNIQSSITDTIGSSDSFIKFSQTGTESVYCAFRLSTDGSFNIDSNLGTWLTTPSLTILRTGNVGIGNSTPTEKLHVVGNAKVSGHFSAATKSFLIDHPTKEGKKLQYGVVESNQHSVLVRGTTAENIIELPEEWAGLVHENSVTVQLTPVGSYQQLFVISQDNQRVVVGGSTGQYNYTIYGERKDVDKLITEI